MALNNAHYHFHPNLTGNALYIYARGYGIHSALSKKYVCVWVCICVCVFGGGVFSFWILASLPGLYKCLNHYGRLGPVELHIFDREKGVVFTWLSFSEAQMESSFYTTDIVFSTERPLLRYILMPWWLKSCANTWAKRDGWVIWYDESQIYQRILHI